jgi:hemolysin III
MSLIFCYAASTAFHSVPIHRQSFSVLRRVDHIGIYLLISGTYTPVAWSLLRGRWSWGTLATVWTLTALCATQVWYWGVLPIWISTATYLAMGWGALFCYFELARTYSHRTLLPLPLGGMFYSVGAVFNVVKWPVLSPGVFGAHELFHFFVIAGTACHIYFMLKVVVPAPGPILHGAPAKSRVRSALLLRWVRFVMTRRMRKWMLRLPHPRWLEEILIASEERDPVSPDSAVKVA